MKLKEILEKHKPICLDEHILIVDQEMNILENLTIQQPSIYSECEFIRLYMHEDNMIALSIYNDKEE